MVNRTICSVFKEMRKVNKNRTYNRLIGLIEEAQTMANRMEAALYDQSDLEYAREEYKELKEEIKQLRKKKKKLNKEA